MFLRKMGLLILFMAASSFSTVSFPNNATAEEVFPENFKKLSSLYSYNDENPYISGDFVVWAAKSGPIALTHQIMLYDLSVNKEVRLTNNTFDNDSPAVDSQFKLVVYKSVRNGLYGIYVCQYDPAQALCPEVKISEDANYKYYTEIEGNRIVWVEFASVAPYRRIYYCDYDFAGNCPKQLVASGDSISRPNLEGNLLLWEDRTAYDGGTQTEHLFLHDLSTGKTHDLDKGDNNIGNMAAVDGNTIVWAKQKFNVSLNRWERVLVSCEYKPQDAPNVCSMREIDTTMGKTTLYAPSHPSVSGQRVVYRNDLERDPSESVPMNHDIYHYNLGTGEILRLTTEVTSQAIPMVAGNRVVWREADAFNNIFIWLYEFKAPTPPPAAGDDSFIQRITNDTVHQLVTHIAGDWIVWNESGKQTVFVYNIATGLRFLLNDYISAYDVAGNKVVYFNSYTHVFKLYDLDTRLLQQIPITNAWSASFVHMSGDKIAWFGFLRGDTVMSLLYYNMTTKEIRKIPLDTTRYNGQPRIAGDLIVWPEGVWNATKTCFISRNLLQYDLRTGAKTILQPGISAIPGVWNDKLSWQEMTYNPASGGYDFIIFDAKTGERRRLGGLSKIYNYITALSETKFVWKEVPLSTETHIFQYDLNSGEKKQITVFPYVRNYIDADGERIVWTEYRDGNYDVFLYNPPKNLARCGDAVIQPEAGEVCDSDSASCLTADGYVGTQVCNAQCSGFDNCMSRERCGDGVLNGKEQCDGLAGVGLHQECSSSCTLVNLPYCGDGIKNGLEECDGLAGVGAHQECSVNCTLVNLPYCGDGIVNGTEQCDGLAGVGLHQECSTDCTLVNLPYCGDGVKNGTEVCDLSSQSCKTADGYSGTQSCNTQCSGFDNCVSSERCGDGILNGKEQCDGTAGVIAGQKCTAMCTLTQADDGDSRKKVVVCHIPPGNPGKAHTIQISRSALKAHLAHGDTLGACKLPPPAPKQKQVQNVTAASKNGQGKKK